MGKYIGLDELLGYVIFPMGEKGDIHRPGIKKDVLRYIEKNNPNKVKNENGTILIDKTVHDENFVSDYLKKTENDFSAGDCTDFLLKHPGVPPEEYMHPSTITDLFRELFKNEEFIGDVYVKRTQGGKYAPCINFQTVNKVLVHPLVMEKLKIQIKKAEKNHECTAEYRQYECEKRAIELMEERRQDSDNDTGKIVLSEKRETKEMVKAIYSLLFTEFDFDAYASDVDAVGLLADNMEFDERYQELNDTLYGRNYNFKYYKLNPNPQLIDAIAEKVADKLIKYFEGERESR